MVRLSIHKSQRRSQQACLQQLEDAAVQLLHPRQQQTVGMQQSEDSNSAYRLRVRAVNVSNKRMILLELISLPSRRNFHTKAALDITQKKAFDLEANLEQTEAYIRSVTNDKLGAETRNISLKAEVQVQGEFRNRKAPYMADAYRAAALNHRIE
jgi:hypothetical protein